MFSVTPKNKRPRQSPEPVADRESPVHGGHFTGYGTVKQYLLPGLLLPMPALMSPSLKIPRRSGSRHCAMAKRKLV